VGKSVHISSILRQFWYASLASNLHVPVQFGSARRRASSSFSRLDVTVLKARLPRHRPLSGSETAQQSIEFWM